MARNTLTQDLLIEIAPTDNPQAIIDNAYDTLDLAGKRIEFHLNHGVFWAPIAFRGRMTGQRGLHAVRLTGDITSPISTIVATAGVDAITVDEADVYIAGIQPQASGTQGNAFTFINHSNVQLEAVAMGSAPGYLLQAAQNSIVNAVSTNIQVNGSGAGFSHTSGASQLTLLSTDVVIASGLGYPTAFIVSASAGYTHFVNVAFPNTGLGSPYVATTGPKFRVYSNGIYSDGSNHDQHWLPGNQDGFVFSGGRYNDQDHF